MDITGRDNIKPVPYVVVYYYIYTINNYYERILYELRLCFLYIVSDVNNMICSRLEVCNLYNDHMRSHQ